MNNLSTEVKPQTLDSREVAEMTGKEHSNLMKDIRRYIEQSAKVKIDLGEFFQERTYQDANKQTRPCYTVTRKGCEFIANKLTGIKGTEFTAKYINRFHNMEETIQTGMLQNLSPELQAIMMHDRKIQVVEYRVDKLENTMTVDHEQKLELERIRKSRAVTILGGMDSNAYKAISGKVFRSIGHDYKEYFKINAYGNTPVARFDEAKQYLKNWQPDNNLQIEINRVNREKEKAEWTRVEREAQHQNLQSAT